MEFSCLSPRRALPLGFDMLGLCVHEVNFDFISPVQRVQLLQVRQQHFAGRFLYVQLKTQQLSFMMELNELV